MRAKLQDVEGDEIEIIGDDLSVSVDFFEGDLQAGMLFDEVTLREFIKALEYGLEELEARNGSA